MHLITPPVGSALWLKVGVTPSGLGYAGTWERRHLVVMNVMAWKALDVANGSTENSANVDIYERNNTVAQRWCIGTVTADTSTEQDYLELWVRTA